MQSCQQLKENRSFALPEFAATVVKKPGRNIRPLSPCAAPWSSRPGRALATPAAGPAPAGPGSPVPSAPGTPSSASSDTAGCRPPPHLKSSQELLIQELQGLLQVRRHHLPEHLPQPAKPPEPGPQCGLASPPPWPVGTAGRRAGTPLPP